MKFTIFTLFIATVGFGCKPGVQSRILETGGETSSWRATTTLNANGDLQIARTDASASDKSPTFNRVDLQVATAPDGTIPVGRLVSKKWIALTEGTDDLTFNVLMTTAAKRLCYINGSRLSGQSEAVFCKSDILTAEAPSEARNLQTQRETCLRLTTTRVETDKGNFARADATSTDIGCTCTNGRERLVRYDDQKGKDPVVAGQAFEAACRRKEPTTTGGDLSSEEKNYNACVDLTALATWTAQRTDVYPGVTSCNCGKERLTYSDARFVDNATAFTKMCKNLGSIIEPSPSVSPSPGTSSSSSVGPKLTGTDDALASHQPATMIKEMKTACTTRGLYDKGSYCDCRDDGIVVMKTDLYSSYKSLADFKVAADKLTCD